MRRRWLCGALAALALGLSGCAAGMPEASPSPSDTGTERIATATPSEATSAAPVAPSATPRANLAVTVDGKRLMGQGLREEDETFLPLVETAQALGYTADVAQTQADGRTRCVHTFSMGEDAGREVTVSYLVQDNTVTDVQFARGKLIVHVDRVLQFEGDTVYAPEDFFEEAMEAEIDDEDGRVTVLSAAGRGATSAPGATQAPGTTVSPG